MSFLDDIVNRAKAELDKFLAPSAPDTSMPTRLSPTTTPVVWRSITDKPEPSRSRPLSTQEAEAIERERAARGPVRARQAAETQIGRRRPRPGTGVDVFQREYATQTAAYGPDDLAAAGPLVPTFQGQMDQPGRDGYAPPPRSPPSTQELMVGLRNMTNARPEAVDAYKSAPTEKKKDAIMALEPRYEVMRTLAAKVARFHERGGALPDDSAAMTSDVQQALATDYRSLYPAPQVLASLSDGRADQTSRRFASDRLGPSNEEYYFQSEPGRVDRVSSAGPRRPHVPAMPGPGQAAPGATPVYQPPAPVMGTLNDLVMRSSSDMAKSADLFYGALGELRDHAKGEVFGRLEVTKKSN